MGINDFPMQPPQKPVEVTGIWLDAHSGRIRVRAEIGGEWRTIIDEQNEEGHISHIIEPAGMRDAKPSVELSSPKT